MEDPLLIGLWFEIRIGMKCNFFQSSLFSLVLKDKYLGNDSQHLLHFLESWSCFFFKADGSFELFSKLRLRCSSSLSCATVGAWPSTASRCVTGVSTVSITCSRVRCWSSRRSTR